MKLRLLLSAVAISVLPLRASDTLGALGVDQTLPTRAEMRAVHDEVDPKDQQSCYAMGQISVTYKSGEVGPPNVGLRITDPRGRKVGYDPRTNQGWQELPLAQGYVECDANEDTGEARHCAGYIQICGPISGTYKVEVLPSQPGKYSVSVAGTSQQTRDERGFRSTDSQVELNSEIQKQTPETFLLKYSREAGTQVELFRGDERVARGEKTQSGMSER